MSESSVFASLARTPRQYTGPTLTTQDDLFISGVLALLPLQRPFFQSEVLGFDVDVPFWGPYRWKPTVSSSLPHSLTQPPCLLPHEFGPRGLTNACYTQAQGTGAEVQGLVSILGSLVLLRGLPQR